MDNWCDFYKVSMNTITQLNLPVLCLFVESWYHHAKQNMMFQLSMSTMFATSKAHLVVASLNTGADAKSTIEKKVVATITDGNST